MSATETHAGFAGWAIVEVFGHRKLGGYVQVSPPEMPGLVRVDVQADGDPIATQYYGPSAIFCLTPCTEAVARALAKRCEVRPVATWELPAPEPEHGHGRRRPDYDDEDRGDYYDVADDED